MVSGEEGLTTIVEELVHVLVLFSFTLVVGVLATHHVGGVLVGIHVVHESIVTDLGVGVNSSKVIVYKGWWLYRARVSYLGRPYSNLITAK